LKEQCEELELEELEKKGRSELMYEKVKSLSNKKTRNTRKKDKPGKELTDPKEKGNRWKEHIEELYDREGKPAEDQLDLGPCIEEQEDPQIMKSEFEETLKKLKNKKAEGIDKIPAEFLRQVGEKAMKELYNICCKICEEGQWPKDCVESIVIPIKKKVGAEECSDY